ncbi:OmpH family outer membrane protein [Erythrobacteraceae bacterium CFH 75059]|uniref:OmpH family outer membrane protein n=1 Tax=Qipengyuania thermophila TaxID=2509361 RepID=UPI0010220B5F|nr:OmpH family outer membrane protein [Qipengyuania thermophila]TCD05021.1 OmpH family outer membrane protein [Erythrobacteraceae bacterium CFH 75059]
MKTIFSSLAALGLVTAGAALISEAPAQAQVVRGIGVVNLRAVAVNTSAYTTAAQQRQVTYRAQIEQAEQRRQQLNAQLQPLAQRFNTDRQAANPNQQSLQQQYQQIQQIQQAGQEEIQRILAPVALSVAYVEEQISDQLNTAVENVARRRNITLIFDPSTGSPIYADAAYNMNQDVINEMNRLLPAAQLVPPAGWQPREIREAQAAQNGAAQQQPQQTPAGQQPTGR